MDQNKQRKVCVFTMHPAKDLRVFNRQCCSLKKNGWDVTLIAISDRENYTEEGVKVICFKKWKTKWQRLKTIIRIAQEAYRQKADIYHFHDPDLLMPAVFLKFITKKPFIYDIHEYFDIIFSLKLPNIWVLRKPFALLVFLFETFNAKLIGNISAVYETHVNRFSRLGCRVIHTPNYASIDNFVPIPVSDEEWNERHKKVIHIGTLDPSRGSFVLLDIVREVKKQRPDIQFLITRRFLADYQEKVMLEKMALPEYQDVVEFIPGVDGKKLSKVIRQAGVALSLGQDTIVDQTGVPTKLFEYMSQAVPILVSDLPHGRKYVRDEGCGFTIKPDDAKEFSDKIIYLVDNISVAKEMGSKGQKAFSERLNWSFVEKRLVAFYDLIMQDE